MCISVKVILFSVISFSSFCFDFNLLENFKKYYSIHRFTTLLTSCVQLLHFIKHFLTLFSLLQHLYWLSKKKKWMWCEHNTLVNKLINSPFQGQCSNVWWSLAHVAHQYLSISLSQAALKHCSDWEKWVIWDYILLHCNKENPSYCSFRLNQSLVVRNCWLIFLIVESYETEKLVFTFVIVVILSCDCHIAKVCS